MLVEHNMFHIEFEYQGGSYIYDHAVKLDCFFDGEDDILAIHYLSDFFLDVDLFLAEDIVDFHCDFVI